MESDRDVDTMANEETPTPAGTSRTTDNLSSLPTDLNDSQGGDLFFGVELLHKMDMDDITELGRRFPSAGTTLDRLQFVEAVQEVAGDVSVSAAAGKLFDLIATDSRGRVSWDQLLDALLERTEPSDRAKHGWYPVDPAVQIFTADHCKREPIAKIVALETRAAFCYAVVSRLGRVGVYDGRLRFLDGYKLALKPNEEMVRDGDKEETRRRSQTTWIADVVHVADSNSLLYASSDRSLHLYDATCLIHIPIARIVGLPHVPTCLEYFSGGEQSLLFVGDDCGNVTTMRFHRARESLFRKKHPDKLDSYYWSELADQVEYVTYSTQKNVHNDAVLQMSYCPGNDTLLSCSNDGTNTLVIRHVDGRREPYVFRVTRGIKCFHYDRFLHVIATGSNDFAVRIWNEVVTKQPIVALYGHKSPIVDVRIVRFMSAVLSLSREGVLKVWHVNDHFCQMTIQLQFPILKVPGARVDFGVRSIYPGPKAGKETSNGTSSTPREMSGTSGGGLDEVEALISTLDFAKRENQWNRRSIVVACSNYVALLRLVPLSWDGEDFFEGEGTCLPPPPKEHYASVPSPWRLAESYTRTPEGSDESSSTGLSSGSSSTKGRMRESRKYHNFTSDTIKSPMRNMNTKRTQYVIRQEQMRMLVEQCAPHLALDLHELEPIKFSKPLPVTRSMREKGIDVSDPERVIKAKIHRDATLISVGSSSGEVPSPRSSSKSSRSTFPRKKLTPGKGRLTPEWFAERIQPSYLDSSDET